MDRSQSATNRVTRLLRDAARSGSEPMGFANRANATSTPAILIIASIDTPGQSGNSVSARSLATGELDPANPSASPVIARITAGLVDSSVRVRAARANFDLIAAELGAFTFDGLSSADGAPMAAIVDAPSPGTPPQRGLGELPVEAFLVRRMAPSLSRWTGLDLLALRQLSDSVRQWVIVIADQGSHPTDLQALRDAGIVGVIVTPDADLEVWRSAALTVRVRRPSPRGDNSVTLPQAAATTAAPPADDDDDESGNRTDA